MRLSVALTCLEILKYQVGDLGKYGMTAEEQNFLTGDTVFMKEDSRQVMRLFESVVFGGMDDLGMPRVEVCAEWVGACIVACIHPLNYFQVCQWASRARSIDKDSQKEFDPITPGELYRYVIRVRNDDDDAHHIFQKKVAAKVAKATPEVAK